MTDDATSILQAVEVEPVEQVDLTLTRTVIRISSKLDYSNYYVLPWSLRNQIPHMVDVMTKDFGLAAKDVDIDFVDERVKYVG